MSGDASGDLVVLSEEATVDGSVYAYDHQANAGYVNVDPSRSARLDASVQVSDGIVLDYAADGSLYGIERIGGPVDRWALMRVIRHLAHNGSSSVVTP